MRISLADYIKDPEVAKRFEYNLNIKSKVRHKVIESFEDFDDKSKEYLLSLKNEVFEGNNIYVFGSRVNGTYLSDDEYEKYSKEYTNVKKSDWDIKSLYKPDREKLKLFETENNVKIDFQLGNSIIKI